ncbi:DNA polymerase IV [Heliorestis acidaminivorans]|uniref:DNA polymerase IV n=1 Tax=Heliorestis acidaminivorans TaxID=553427 RepID=A0A6I0EW72_9FIRM|nr:DNA polymerase IV [Heliorestis acidaminivorans]KAB2952305.1 DNA polymerase IV [Heliorestis acidaminivorans]
MKERTNHDTILLADMNSFYASVEASQNPALQGKAVLVCGDPERRHGIILAASKEAKAYGIKTAMTVGEALALCPEAQCVQPRMALYLEISWKIQQIARTFSPLVEPYSVDELFIDTAGTEEIWPSAEEVARLFRHRLREELKIPCSIGISHNKFLAKMACDIEAKKNPQGIAFWKAEDIAKKLHPLPLRKMFMVGSRMESHFRNMGLMTIGDLAHYPLHYLTKRFGLRGEIYHHLAWGRDHSPVSAHSLEKPKGIGHSITLPKDYYRREEIETVLLELTDQVCSRARRLQKAGRTITVSLRSYDLRRGFHRQSSLPAPSNLSEQVFSRVQLLFHRHWNGLPVRSLSVGIDNLVDDHTLQQELFVDWDQQDRLHRAIDDLRARFGSTAILRGSSLTTAGVARDRAKKIGGHEA